MFSIMSLWETYVVCIPILAFPLFTASDSLLQHRCKQATVFPAYVALYWSLDELQTSFHLGEKCKSLFNKNITLLLMNNFIIVQFRLT